MYFSQFRFTCRAKDELSLPPYKGSTLRGAFGITFRRLVCITKLPECPPCILRHRCSYSYIFETPITEQMGPLTTFEPHPFVIEPPPETKELYRAGESFEFDLVLIGRAVDFLPYFIFTIDQMGDIGIGRGRGRYRLEKVSSHNPFAQDRAESVIYEGRGRPLNDCFHRTRFDPEVLAKSELLSVTNDADSRLTICFVTPARIKFQNHLITDIDFQIFWSNLTRRLSMLSAVHCDNGFQIGQTDAAHSIRTERSNLHWVDWERYSERQQTRMKLGGFCGEVTFEGNLKRFLPYILLGQYLHIGKGTSFGLGKYEIQI